jgi:hypothetical protein
MVGCLRDRFPRGDERVAGLCARETGSGVEIFEF